MTALRASLKPLPHQHSQCPAQQEAVCRASSCGEGHPRGHARVTNGAECFSPEPTLKAHQLFMAIKRPNFLAREGPTAQSTAGQTRRGSLGTAPAGSLKSLSERTPQAAGSLRGAGSEERVGPTRSLLLWARTEARPRPRPAGRCVHPLNNLHPPGNGPQRCQSH